jgi:small GTP-binding protein
LLQVRDHAGGLWHSGITDCNQGLDGKIRCKLVVVGDSAVGKTAASSVFASDRSTDTGVDKHKPTIGAEWKSREVTVLLKDAPLPLSLRQPVTKLRAPRRGALRTDRVSVDVWDTSGQPRVRAIVPMYLRGSAGVLVVYNTANLQSFQNIEGWLDLIRTGRTTCLSMAILLVGANADPMSVRVVSTAEGAALAAKHKVDFAEMSTCNPPSVNKVCCYFPYFSPCVLVSGACACERGRGCAKSCSC